jgi:hypothetical protein
VGGGVVVGDVRSDGEGQLSTGVDIAEEDGGDGRSTLRGREVGEKNGGNVGVVHPLAHVNLSGSVDDDDGVVVATGGVLDELIASVGELL